MQTSPFKVLKSSLSNQNLGFILEHSKFTNIIFGNKYLSAHELEYLSQTFNFKPYTLNQKHTTKVVARQDLIDTNLVCDGVITSFTQEALVIRTADCLPLIAVSDTSVAALHCGRKGLLDGIIKSLAHQASHVSYTHFYIGPHIHFQNYEIGKDLFTEIQNSFPQTQALKVFNHKFCFCLKTFATEHILTHFPLAQIFELEIDTYTDQNYNSYRRDQKTLERNLSLVWKKG